MKKTLLPLLFLSSLSCAFAQEAHDTGITRPDTGKLSTILTPVSTTTYPSPLDARIATNFTKLLDGKATGLLVTNGGGQPGSVSEISVQGINSITNNNEPLIVVDGAPYYGDINAINIQDIDHISVLKDAVAGLRYGGQSGNGVIEVVTKSGKGAHRKWQLTLDAQAGIVTRELPTYNTIKDPGTYYELAWDSYRNAMMSYGYSQSDAGLIASGISGNHGIVDILGYNNYNVPNNELIDPVTGKLNPNATLQYPYESWKDAMQRIALKHNYNLSFSGGNDKNDYYLSAGYLNEDGYIKETGYERFTARGNGNIHITPWLKAGINASIASATQHYIYEGNDSPYNPFYTTTLIAPIYPVYYYDANGNRQPDPITGKDKFDWGSLDYIPNSSMGNRASFVNINTNGSLYLDNHQNKTFSTNLAPYIDINFLKHFIFSSRLYYNYDKLNNEETYNPDYGQFATQGGLHSGNESTMKAWDWNETLEWSQSFGRHSLDILAGYEKLKIDYLFWGNSTSNGGGTPMGSYRDGDMFRTESYFAIANYNYNEKYFLTGGFRRDKRSEYALQWSNNWAMGAAWQISNEKFMKTITWINLLKLKANYGQQGAPFTNSYIPYSAPVSSLGNPDLHAPYTKQLDIGIESRFFNRVTFYADYFRKRNDNIIAIPYPGSTGLSYGYKNGFIIANNGIEVSLNIDIIRNNPSHYTKFSWDIGLNFTHYNNQIMHLPGGIDSLIDGNTILKKGTSAFEFYLPQSAGVDPANGDELYYYKDNGVQKTTNDYSLATEYGRKSLGSALPKGFGSVSNRFRYKNWDLQFMFTYSFGGKYYDQVYQALMNGEPFAGNNWSEDMLNRWTPENTNTNIPRLEMDNLNIAQASSRFLLSGSYLSLRSASIGYSFPDRMLRNIKLQNLTIYCAADNIWLWTKRKGMNPEAAFYGGPGYVYAPARTVMIGLKVGL